jgi:hypothetical protein
MSSSRPHMRFVRDQYRTRLTGPLPALLFVPNKNLVPTACVGAASVSTTHTTPPQPTRPQRAAQRARGKPASSCSRFRLRLLARSRPSPLSCRCAHTASDHVHPVPCVFTPLLSAIRTTLIFSVSFDARWCCCQEQLYLCMFAHAMLLWPHQNDELQRWHLATC